jgi:hypothetical protein
VLKFFLEKKLPAGGEKEATYVKKKERRVLGLLFIDCIFVDLFYLSLHQLEVVSTTSTSTT